MKSIKHLSNFSLLGFIFLLIAIKLLFFISIKNDFLAINLGGGDDAEYYDGYAEGVYTIAVNVWPVILRYLNGVGLYSRELISYIFFILNIFFIPMIVAKISGIKIKDNQKYFLYIYLVCLLYPTLYFFTFDIYRDVFMVVCFLIGCLFIKYTLNSSNFLYFNIFLVLSISVGALLFTLRPYLGVAFLGSLLLFNIKFTKRRLILLGTLYLIALWGASYIGVFDSITEYRSGFDEIEAGSNLGLDFSNPLMFIPNFILSFLGQILGLYIVNPLAMLLFLIETIPFLFMLIYVIKNIKWADKFVRFLIIFFVLYGSVWLIGNDNLGTALRLRMYNYFSIYISFFYVLDLKLKFLNKL